MPDDLLVTVKLQLARAADRHWYGEDHPFVILATAVRPLLDRCATAEASYQEAQVTIAGLEAEVVHHRTEAARLRERWDAVLALVNEQAEDESLWFVAQYLTEADLQAALRRLHAAVEGEQ